MFASAKPPAPAVRSKNGSTMMRHAAAPHESLRCLV